MKTSLKKKEIRSTLETALINEIEKLEGTNSSKKLKRVIRKHSRDIAQRVKLDMKKRSRKAEKKHTGKKSKAVNGYLIETGAPIENDHA